VDAWLSSLLPPALVSPPIGGENLPLGGGEIVPGGRCLSLGLPSGAGGSGAGVLNHLSLDTVTARSGWDSTWGA
jgi:hypothetical protein